MTERATLGNHAGCQAFCLHQGIGHAKKSSVPQFPALPRFVTQPDDDPCPLSVIVHTSGRSGRSG
jgi:hypothetical protein